MFGRRGLLNQAAAARINRSAFRIALTASGAYAAAEPQLGELQVYGVEAGRRRGYAIRQHLTTGGNLVQCLVIARGRRPADGRVRAERLSGCPVSDRMPLYPNIGVFYVWASDAQGKLFQSICVVPLPQLMRMAGRSSGGASMACTMAWSVACSGSQPPLKRSTSWPCASGTR